MTFSSLQLLWHQTYCYQNERLKHFSGTWLRLCSCLQMSRKWRPTSLRPSLCSPSYAVYLVHVSSLKRISGVSSCFGRMHHSWTKRSWPELSSCGQGHRLSPVPGHCAPAKLCNRPSASNASTWGVSGDWREMGRLWHPSQGITSACELRWMKTFKIRLLRLVPRSWLTEAFFLNFFLLCLACCFWHYSSLVLNLCFRILF